MNSKYIKLLRYERYFFAAALTCLMVAIAEWTGQREIIFPEIAALTIGCWIAEKQPWVSNKRKIFLLVSLASLIGVCVVRYLTAPLLVEVAVCFMFVGIALTLTKTTLIPIISACILPVYLQTTTWVYPVSVTIMSGIIIFMQWVMEKRKIRPKNTYIPCEFNYKIELKKWTKLLILLVIIALVPVQSKNLYFMAPPLIVTLAAFSNPDNAIRKIPAKIIACLTIAAIVGTLVKLILNSYLHIPLPLCAVFACLLLFLTFEKIHTLFPPAGAILLLPLILKPEDMMYYPLEVLIGSVITVYLTIWVFKKKKKPLPIEAS